MARALKQHIEQCIDDEDARAWIRCENLNSLRALRLPGRGVPGRSRQTAADDEQMWLDITYSGGRVLKVEATGWSSLKDIIDHPLSSPGFSDSERYPTLGRLMGVNNDSSGYRMIAAWHVKQELDKQSIPCPASPTPFTTWLFHDTPAMPKAKPALAAAVWAKLLQLTQEKLAAAAAAAAEAEAAAEEEEGGAAEGAAAAQVQPPTLQDALAYLQRSMETRRG